MRPTAEEMEKYVKLFEQAQDQGEDYESSIRLALQAILVSPRFVVLWGDAGASRNDKSPVRPLGKRWRIPSAPKSC